MKFFRKLLRQRETMWKPLIGGSSTIATDYGISVTHDSALTLGAVWACVRAVTETIATLPIHIYRRDGDRRVIDESHALSRVLRMYANEEMSAVEFFTYMIGHLEIRGNAYAEIERNARGDVVALYPLHPDRVTPRRDATQRIVYRVMLDNNQQVILPREKVLHLKFLSLDGISGTSPVRYAATAIASGLAARQYGARVFSGDGMKRLALVTDKPLSQEQQRDIREAWNIAYGGLTNSQRVAILQGGLRPEVIGIDPQDAQMLEMWNATINDVCRIWRVPPHKIGQLEKATLSVEELNIDWVTDSILPRTVNIESALNSAFLRNEPDTFIKFNLDGLLRGRIADRMDAYAKSIQWGIRTRNEVRQLENLDPIASLDFFERPLNMERIE